MTADDLLARIRSRRQLRPGLARALRREAGVSQEEVAEALDVDPSTVSKWESGDRTPRGPRADRYQDLLKRLAAALRHG